MTILFSFAACHGQLSSDELNDIYDRLELVDEFAEESVPVQAQSSAAQYKDGTFRSVPFGSYRVEVMNAEPLALAYEYSNAVEYYPALVFNYSMTPTYFFNSYDQFYSGSYSMTSEESFKTISSKMTGMLIGLYGQPENKNYYDYNDNVFTVSNGDNVISYINNGTVYYYVWFSYDDIDIELVIEAEEPNQTIQKYNIYIYYTDYTYNY